MTRWVELSRGKFSPGKSMRCCQRAKKRRCQVSKATAVLPHGPAHLLCMAGSVALELPGWGSVGGGLPGWKAPRGDLPGLGLPGWIS